MSNTRKIKVKKKKENKKEEVDELTLMVRESLGSMGRSVNPYQEKMLVQIYKAFIVGGVCTIIDFVLFIVFYKLVKLDPVIANAISFGVSLIYGLWSSFKYTFQDKKKDLLEYLILMVLGLIVTEVILWFVPWSPILFKFLSILLVIGLKFCIRKFILKKK